MRAAIYMRVGNPDQLEVQNQTEVLTGQIEDIQGNRNMVEIAEKIIEAVSSIST